jgi:hypothetical protein
MASREVRVVRILLQFRQLSRHLFEIAGLGRFLDILSLSWLVIVCLVLTVTLLFPHFLHQRCNQIIRHDVGDKIVLVLSIGNSQKGRWFVDRIVEKASSTKDTSVSGLWMVGPGEFVCPPSTVVKIHGDTKNLCVAVNSQDMTSYLW